MEFNYPVSTTRRGTVRPQVSIWELKQQQRRKEREQLKKEVSSSSPSIVTDVVSTGISPATDGHLAEGVQPSRLAFAGEQTEPSVSQIPYAHAGEQTQQSVSHFDSSLPTGRPTQQSAPQDQEFALVGEQIQHPVSHLDMNTSEEVSYSLSPAVFRPSKKTFKSRTSGIVNTDVSLGNKFFPSWFSDNSNNDIEIDNISEASLISIIQNPQINAKYAYNILKRQRHERQQQLHIHAVIVELETEKPVTSGGIIINDTPAKGKERMEGERPNPSFFEVKPEARDTTLPKVGESSPKKKQKSRKGSKTITHRFRCEKSQIPSGTYFATQGGDNNSPPSSPSNFNFSSSSSESNVSNERFLGRHTTPLAPPSSLSAGDSSSDSGNSGNNGGGDGSGGSSSSSHSSSSPGSSSSNNGKKRKKKATSPSSERHRKKHRNDSKEKARKERKLLAGLKVRSPPTYSGEVNLEKFDQWTFAYDNWVEMHALNTKWSVWLLVNFLSGKAATFYMRHVALNKHQWTRKQVYDGLFNYCFPHDFKIELRQKLTNYYQGRMLFIDFAREVENLAGKFPDVSKWQRIQIIWRGAQQYLRLKWLEHGLNPEKVKWRELIAWGTNIEAAQLQKERELRKPRNGGCDSLFRNTKPRYDRQPGSSQPFKSGSSTPNRSSNQWTSSEVKAERNDFKNRSGRRDEGKRLTRQEMNELRAEGRCFNCRKEGHESRNCPDRRSAPAPRTSKVSSSSVRFAKLEKLAEQKREADIKIFGVRIAENQQDEFFKVQDSIYLVWLKRQLEDLYGPEGAIIAGQNPAEQGTTYLA
ncbi:hypothetical protein M422DRAFT_239077 [Sphaerobolus stellatus SS14]|nr:hypothetical protein M422DRAFT_239077 [Sphaerobolus stellatus SS14]